MQGQRGELLPVICLIGQLPAPGGIAPVPELLPIKPQLGDVQHHRIFGRAIEKMIRFPGAAVFQELPQALLVRPELFGGQAFGQLLPGGELEVGPVRIELIVPLLIPEGPEVILPQPDKIRLALQKRLPLFAAQFPGTIGCDALGKSLRCPVRGGTLLRGSGFGAALLHG